MRKYFLFKHPLTYSCRKGTVCQIEVYSFNDIRELLALTGIKMENVKIMPYPFKVRGMNNEWEHAYSVMGMCNGRAKCIGVTNFKE